jgi:MFS family permease
VLLLSHFGTLISWFIFIVALVLPASPLFAVQSTVLGQFTLTVPLLLLFVARAIDGLTGGNVSVANAYLADITTGADRSASFGRLALSGNLGFVVGPALAGILGATAMGEQLPVLAAFAISAIAMCVIWWTLPDAKPCVITAKLDEATLPDVLGGDRKKCYRISGGAAVPNATILAVPGIRLLLLLQFLVFLAFNFYYVAFPVYAATSLDWTLAGLGTYFAVMSIAMVIVQGPVLSWLASRVGDKALVIGGSVALAGAFALFVASQVMVIYAGALLLALGNGLMWPSLLSVLSKSTTPSLQGAVQGLSGSVTAVASIAGLLVGGGLYQVLGARIFLLAAAITGLVALIALRIDRPGGESKPHRSNGLERTLSHRDVN